MFKFGRCHAAQFVTAGLLLAATARVNAVGVVIHKVALTGEQAPQTQQGVTFAAFTTGFNHDIMRPVIDEQGHVAFIALITGPNVTSSNNHGIWSDRAGEVGLVVRSGNPAPGTAEGVVFFGVPSNYLPFPPSFAGGRIAFQGTLTGPGVNSGNNMGVWAEADADIVLIARMGDAAPGQPTGVRFGQPGGAINTPGDVLIGASLFGTGVNSSNDESRWSTRSGELGLIVREGQPAPGTPAGVAFGGGVFLGSPYAFGAAGFNDNSALALQANLVGPGVNDFNNETLYVERAGELSLLVREGDPAPGAGSGATFGGDGVTLNLTQISFNNLGQVAFMVDLEGDIPSTFAAYSDHTGALAPLAIPGRPAPGTAFNFGLVATPVLNDAGHIAFRASFPDDDGDPFTRPPMGIWWDQNGTVQPLVLPGDVVSDGSVVLGVSFIVGYSAPGILAFAGSFEHPETGYKSGLALARPGGPLQLVAATGDLIDAAGDGQLRQVVRVVHGGLSETGSVAFRLDFSDNSSGHFTAALGAPNQPGDYDGDGDIDLVDYAALANCLQGPAAAVSSDCSDAFDRDADLDVDVADFSSFQVEFPLP